MDRLKTVLYALIGFGLLWSAFVAELKAAEPVSTVFMMVGIVKGTIEIHDRLTGASPAPGPAPAVPVPSLPAAAPYRPPVEVAMVVLPPRPYYRRIFEDSMVADDYPREKGVPEPLPLDQWKELMVDLAVPYLCLGSRPTACNIPGNSMGRFRVFFDVTYEREKG